MENESKRYDLIETTGDIDVPVCFGCVWKDMMNMLSDVIEGSRSEGINALKFEVYDAVSDRLEFRIEIK